MAGRYTMNNDPHGICLIINNHFEGRSDERHGTDNDCSRLHDLFSTLKYEVRVVHNQNGTDMFNILGEISTDKKNEDYDSFVCCILTHGELNGVYGNDGQSRLLYTQIYSIFGHNNSTLRHKPKIFVIQACQQSAVDQRSSTIETVSSGGLYGDGINAKMLNEVVMDDAVSLKYAVDFDQGAETNHADVLIIKCSVPGKLRILVILILVNKTKIFICFSLSRKIE